MAAIKYIKRREIFTVKVSDAVPVDYVSNSVFNKDSASATYYSSEVFTSRNGQEWTVDFQVVDKSSIYYDLAASFPIVQQGKSTRFKVDGKDGQHTFTETSCFYRLLEVIHLKGNWRDQTITIEFLHDESFASDISQALPLLNNEEVSDVEFQIEGKPIYAMSGFLIYYSPYFKTLLTSDFQESVKLDKCKTQKPIVLKELTHNAVLMCFEWIYAGCIRWNGTSIDSVTAQRNSEQTEKSALTIADAMDLYKAADVFLLEDLLSELQLFMEKELTVEPDNFGLVFTFSHKRNLEVIAGKAMKVWSAEAKKISELEKSKKDKTEAQNKEQGVPSLFGGTAGNASPVDDVDSNAKDNVKQQAEIVQDYLQTLSRDEFVKVGVYI
ncbi:hypothetical protein HDV05_003729 [Chytridiales sp. JEL 0842]|nr:hypothetical protein HDV05_003729 [Chytridiales sp. JEL 0842]